MTRELCTKLNMGFNSLEIVVAMLEYCKVFARVKTTVHGVAAREFPIEEKVQDAALSR